MEYQLTQPGITELTKFYELKSLFSFSSTSTPVEHRERMEEGPQLHIEVAGISFLVHDEDDLIMLECEEWPSLSAHGTSMPEALDALFETIGDACKVYLNASDNELTDEARRFRDFLRNSLAM